MTRPETITTEAPPVLYGLRCGEQLHRGHGHVYVKSAGRHQIESLAASNACYELVVSRDGGTTWEAADA